MHGPEEQSFSLLPTCYCPGWQIHPLCGIREISDVQCLGTPYVRIWQNTDVYFIIHNGSKCTVVKQQWESVGLGINIT